MTEDEIKREAREFAYAWLLIKLLAAKFDASPDPSQEVAELRASVQAIGREMTYPGPDPATSDLMVQEIEESLLRTIDRAASLSRRLGPT